MRSGLPGPPIFAKIRFGVDPQFELATLLRGRRIDSGGSQPSQMIGMLVWIDDVNRLVATSESVLDERKQNPILFLVAVEEGTDMP